MISPWVAITVCRYLTTPARHIICISVWCTCVDSFWCGVWCVVCDLYLCACACSHLHARLPQEAHRCKARTQLQLPRAMRTESGTSAAAAAPVETCHTICLNAQHHAHAACLPPADSGCARLGVSAAVFCWPQLHLSKNPCGPNGSTLCARCSPAPWLVKLA
jgi:hypothetical protein